ncbi:hypothetical protein SAMN04487948_11113 [Halogranum amylolyticum]|uniref:Uncharacterized protein n=1 Tax=Halogranum amylolyticum TaxID=660520 RepID=A0A1H8UHK1_9EURY|nr:hypothetical protein [Halogranum amylolyticum]SEP02364.1 hypothetical protein SAMN04487948_11113 [Halogranum amylolyticum]
MYNTNNRSLGSLSEDAYELLLTAIEPARGLAFEEALGHLREEGFSEGDAEYAVERLLLRGYLYEVDGELFVTTRENSSSE